MRFAKYGRTWIAGLFVALSAAPLLGEGVVYELRMWSLLRDECEFCDRIPIAESIAGSFLLTQLPAGFPGELYELTEIDFRSKTGEIDYKVSGSGLLTVMPGDPPSHEMKLQVEVNGTSGIELTGGPVKASSPWPLFDITVAEQKPYRDPDHIFTMRIVAAPRVEMVPYEALQGSYLADECEICGRPTIFYPLHGSFLLGKVATGILYDTYRVDEVNFWESSGTTRFHITGNGDHVLGGEVALLQEMNLRVTVILGGTDRVEDLFGSGRVPPEANFPEIGIQLAETSPADPLSVYKIYILAMPVKAGLDFRRGDSNGDGVLDISDPVYSLFSLFGGGPAPECLDAADGNHDGAHDITDAVYDLTFLFLDGPAPPTPGPFICGSAFAPSLGCGKYGACPGSSN